MDVDVFTIASQGLSPCDLVLHSILILWSCIRFCLRLLPLVPNLWRPLLLLIVSKFSQRRRRQRIKAKGKIAVLDPVPAHTPSPSTVVATSSAQEEPPQKKKALKRKHAPEVVAPSEPGSSKLTHSSVTASKAPVIPSATGSSGIAGPSVKKPQFSPKKASKEASHKTMKSATSDALQGSNWMFPGCPKQQFLATELTRAQDSDHKGIPINRHNSHAMLKDYCFKDLVTVPNKFFE